MTARPRVVERLQQRIFTIAYFVVVAPILGELVDKIRSPWRPTGDDAIFAINAHDVFSLHPPLLGTYSVVARVGNESPPLVYHLGPMVSWVLAIPERFFGERLGVAFGAAIVNAVMLVATVWIVRRVFGDPAAMCASIAIAFMAWSVGHSTLAEPWNPYIGLWALPLLAALACAVASGHRWAFGWQIAVASFAIQAHYLYLAIVASVVIVGVVLALLRKRSVSAMPQPLGSLRWSLFAILLCWSPTIFQQIHGNPGNFSNWFRATVRATDSKSPFFDFSSRYIVNAFAIPGLALRGPLSPLDQLKLTDSPSVLAWVSAFGVVAVVVSIALLLRSRNPDVAAFATVTIAVVVSTTLTISQLPVSILAFPYYRIVMLWFASTMLWSCALSGACCAMASLGDRMPVVNPQRFVSALAVAALLVACLAATSKSPEGPVDPLGARATGVLSAGGKAQLNRQRRFTVIGSGARGIFAAYGVFRELHNAGFEVYVPNDEVQLRRVYAVGTRSTDALVVQSGVEHLPENAVVIATFDGRSRAERHEYEVLQLAAATKDPDAEQKFEQQRFGFEQSQFRLYVLPQ